MAYNGSGTFNITTAGQPVVTGTVISSTAFNALTADLATGLSTAITKDGQTTTTARITFAQGVSSTLVTDATSATTGSIITAGGISTQKALWVGTTSRLVGNVQANGNLGIGRTPSFPLDVLGEIHSTPAVNYTTAASVRQFVAGEATNNANYAMNMGYFNDGSYRGSIDCIAAGAATTLTLNASGGQVGIGMTPARTLDVTGTFGVTGASTLGGALTYGGVTLSNAVTGTGNMVLSASPTLTGTLTAAAGTFSSDVSLNNGTSTSPVLKLIAAGFWTWGIKASGNTFSVVYDSNTAFSFNSGTGFSLPNALTYGGVTLSNSVTGTGSMVLSAGPTFNSGASAQAAIYNSTAASGVYTTWQTSGTDIGYVGAAAQLGSGSASALAVRSTGDLRFFSNGSTLAGMFGTDQSFLQGTTTNGGWTANAANVVQRTTNACYSAYNSGVGVNMYYRLDNASGYFCAFNYGASTAVGSITTNGTTTSYNVTSDYRLKENVQPMTGGLATVAALKPVTYDWISNGSAGEGFIAHELQAVIPEAVHGEKDAVNEDGSINAQGVDFGKIVPHLVAAIQELTARLTALENK